VRDVALNFSAKADERILDIVKPKTPAQEQALLHIAGCLLTAARDGCWIHYSRDRNWYPDRKRYYGKHFGYGPLMAVVDALSEAGLIYNQLVRPGTNNLIRSRMRGTPLLLKLMAGATILPVRHAEVLELRDADRNLIDYRETRQTRSLRRQVQEINEYLNGIRLDHPSARYIPEHDLLVFQDDSVLAPVPYVKRSFCRSRWDAGGRFFGSFGSYQYLSSDKRIALLINGELAVLLDFAAMLVTLVYNSAGIKMDGHPYDIAGFLREEIKLGVNITLNAETLLVAKNALAWKLAEESGHDVTESDRTRAAQIITTIREKHAAIAPAFGSYAGVTAQYRESEIIRAYWSRCRRENIATISVHDEVIVPKRHASRADEILKQVFAEQAPGPNSPLLRVTSYSEIQERPLNQRDT
jgi:hypothetical protein